MDNDMTRSFAKTSYFKIRQMAAARLEIDLKQFVDKYNAEMDDAEGDDFRVLTAAAGAITEMIATLRQATTNERLDELERRNS